MDDLEDYNYVNQSAMDSIPEAEDKQRFELLDHCMNALFSEHEKTAVYNIVKSILNLGNVDFEETHIPGRGDAS